MSKKIDTALLVKLREYADTHNGWPSGPLHGFLMPGIDTDRIADEFRALKDEAGATLAETLSALTLEQRAEVFERIAE